ncbi:MAG TPA: hypothetical protein VK474_08250, partial [Chthoniobacterales bacterium]|nr:hypothetical protein [Chthoniobacterales bacterium]
RPDNTANLVLRLPGATFFHATEHPAHVLVVAEKPADATRLGDSLGPRYRPEGELRILRRPYEARTGHQAQLAVRRWHRVEGPGG